MQTTKGYEMTKTHEQMLAECNKVANFLRTLGYKGKKRITKGIENWHMYKYSPDGGHAVTISMPNPKNYLEDMFSNFNPFFNDADEFILGIAK